jgi:hypothetical protein
MKTIKQYVLDNFETHEIKQITEHGMVSGFGQLIYYTDTCAFHDEYETEIWNMLEEERLDCGYDTIMELIANFNGSKHVGSMNQFKNLLCWYSVESVCQQIIDELEDTE